MLSLNDLTSKSQNNFKIKFANRNTLLAILLLVIFFIYTIDMVFDYIIQNDIINKQYGRVFIFIFCISFILLGLLPVTLFILKINFPTNYKMLNSISIASCFIMFLTGSLYTLLNLSNSNDIAFYTTVILITGFLLVIDTKFIVPFFLINYIFYLSTLFIFSANNTYSLAKLLTTTITVFLSFAFSIVNYQLKIREYINIDTILSQNEKLKNLSMKDALTNLYNRRYFDKSIKSLIDVCILTRKTFTVLMLDIDNFKSINDTYGHQIGDECIKEISNVINDISAKNNGLGFRYGGEEFTLLFSNHNKDDIVNIAENIRTRVENIAIENTDINLTVSIGVYHTQASDATHFAYCIKVADDLLYNVKKLGKNKVLIKED